MNKSDFQEWKNSPVTKEFLSSTLEAQQEVRERSSLKETADQTAMQTAHDEGFCEGIEALASFIDDQMLKYGEPNES